MNYLLGFGVVGFLLWVVVGVVVLGIFIAPLFIWKHAARCSRELFKICYLLDELSKRTATSDGVSVEDVKPHTLAACPACGHRIDIASDTTGEIVCERCKSTIVVEP